MLGDPGEALRLGLFAGALLLGGAPLFAAAPVFTNNFTAVTLDGVRLGTDTCLTATDRQITAGCSASPLLYCPANPNTREQMAVFLTKTFSLLLYGP